MTLLLMTLLELLILLFHGATAFVHFVFFLFCFCQWKLRSEAGTGAYNLRADTCTRKIIKINPLSINVTVASFMFGIYSLLLVVCDIIG